MFKCSQFFLNSPLGRVAISGVNEAIARIALFDRAIVIFGQGKDSVLIDRRPDGAGLRVIL